MISNINTTKSNILEDYEHKEEPESPFGRVLDSNQNKNPKISYSNFTEKYSNFIEVYSSKMSATTIYLANQVYDNEKIIVKKVDKSMLINESIKNVAENEFPLHCSLKHENIVEAYEFTETEKDLYMSMEYLCDAAYFEEKIENCLTPIKNELKIRSFIHDLLEALNYIHSRGIVHLDLKLSNLFIEKFDDDNIPILKLSDFGLSRKLDDVTKKVFLPEKCGTFGYTAPEVKNKANVDSSVDIWSVGICLYKMCVAYKPTQIGDYSYGSGPIPFRKIDWRKRSPDVQDFILKTLDMDPNKRPSAAELLKHKWFDCS